MPGTWAEEGDEMLKAVASAMAEQRAEGWLVGGSVRDREAGRFSPDIDVAVTDDAACIARRAARTLDAPWFTLSQEHRAFRVVGPEAHVDVTAVRGGGILADLAQRDFTINAMARPLGADGCLGDLVDPWAGLADLQRRRLVAVSDRVFLDDPLRLMRAARFAHVLHLELDPALRTTIAAQAEQVGRAAPERVAAEMVLTLEAGAAGAAVRLWQELGLLQAVVPEALPSWAGNEPGTLLDRLDLLLADPARIFPAAAAALRARLAEPVDGAMSRPAALRLAGLLSQLTPSAAATSARRLRLSARTQSLVEHVARMSGWRALPVVGPPSGGPGRDAVLFLWSAAPWEPEVILLASAGGAVRSAEALMALWARRATGEAPGLPLDGNDLKALLGLEAGPRVGKALRAAKLVWEAGEAASREQVLAAARAALDES